MVDEMGHYGEKTTDLKRIESSTDETDILDGQTPEESKKGLEEVSKAYKEDTEKKQEEIEDLTNQLSDVPSMETELFAKFLSGVQVYKALEKEGEDAIQKRLDEFNVYDNYRHWNWKPGIQDTAYSIRQSFSTLLTKSDEEIDEIYERERKSLEEPDGRQFFGDVLVDAEHEAFVNGFFAARNWTTEEWLSDKLKLTAKIIDKLTAAQKRYHENTPR